MNRIIGVTELQRKFRSVFDEVSRKGIPYVLTRGSRPEAALIPYDEYQRYLEFQEAEVLMRFDRLVERMRIQNEAYADEEVIRDIASVRAESSGT
ncbi:MAG: type II toxin-antitoxin system Phd/YefM family antitoxin [Anaerolineales bacterium]